jgi:large subunit ribosomal protein L24
MAAMKVRKGDTVLVLTGKDKGKTGEVLVAMPRDGMVVVAGVNVAKRHLKARTTTDPGGIKDIEKPISASNVSVVAADGKGTRVGYKIDANGTKSRIARRTGGAL